MNVLVCFLLWFGACLGHTVVMVFTMNWLYGCPFPKRIMKPVRKIYAVFLVVSCGYLSWRVYEADFDWGRLLDESNLFFRAYLWFCWLAAFMVFPVATVYNRLARRPAVLLDNHTETVDVARELGFKPIGLGRKRRLAGLPFNQCFQVEFSERFLKLP